MKRSDLLNDLFYFAREKNIEIALARPYFGDAMQGDIDLLIEHKNIKLIDEFIAQQTSLKKTSRYQRPDGETLHIFGVENGEAQAISIDLITSLSMQGIVYLDIKHVLQRAIPDEKNIKTPHEIDQAVIILMTHGIKHKGALKQRYIDYIQSVLKKNPVAFPKILSDLLGDQAAVEFIESLSQNELSDSLWKRLKRKLINQAWLLQGGISLVDRLFYKISRLWCLLTAPKINIAVYGVDGAGKTTLINYMNKTLAITATTIRLPHFLPALPWSAENDSNKILSDPHAKKLRNPVTSVIKLVYLLGRYWLAYLWPRFGSTLFIYDRYLPDMLVDPIRYRYGGPTGLLQLACKLAPRVDASILVDINHEVAQKRKAEVPPMETKRQADIYRQVIAILPNPVTVKGEMPIDRITAIATAHSLQAMMVRAKKEYK